MIKEWSSEYKTLLLYKTHIFVKSIYNNNNEVIRSESKIDLIICILFLYNNF